MAIVGNCTHCLWNAHIQDTHHLIYNNKESREQTKGLECIRPHQCLDATATGIEPYQNDHSRHRDRKRHSPRLEHKAVENHTNHIESCHCSRHLRQQEERGSSLVSHWTQSLSQKGVDGCQIQFIIKR